MLSVIIPSRSPQYLQRTIDDLLAKAEGDIEIIVVLDGYWPNPMVNDNPKVTLFHQGTVHDSFGMRAAINAGVALSKGEYIMKTDEHCMFDKGFDVKLKENCRDNWIVIPRRYRLDAEKWEIIEDGRPPIDYMQVDYPYQRPEDKTCGLHGAEWKQSERAEFLTDDTPTMQGSCYFMTRKHWDTTIKRMEDENYGPFTQEAQELSFKTWLSGGRVVVNKKTWYAHFHKGKTGKGYGFSNEQYKRHAEASEKGRIYAINYWLYTKDYPLDFKWYIDEKFKNSPGWTDWEVRVQKDKDLDYSTTNYKDDFWLANLRK